MADEPSIPMDQEEEDNDEYFSAKESPSRKRSQEDLLKSSTPTPQKSERAGAETSPSSRKSEGRQKTFFSDECAQAGSENSTKKSEKVRRMLKDRNRWDMREYKKEELEVQVKPKKKKKKTSKNKKKAEKVEVEKSKTDEESDEKDEPPSSPAPTSDPETPQPRPFFQSQKLVLQVKADKALVPKCKFRVLRFAKGQEVVEYDAEGQQHQLDHYNERAISNPWRRWGAHRALCDQGGYLVDKNKKLVEIKRGSDPPKCPPNPRQVTLNKNCEAPDSQTMMGTLRVEVGPAEEEVHRIGRAMEDYVKNGGFVPPPMTRKEMQPRTPTRGQPIVVVQTKGGAPKDASAVKKKKTVVIVVLRDNKKMVQKASKPKKKGTQSQSQSGEEDDSMTEEGDSTAEKGKKKDLPPQPPSQPPVPQARDDSKKGGIYGFYKRKKSQFQQKGKARNNKGSSR